MANRWTFRRPFDVRKRRKGWMFPLDSGIEVPPYLETGLDCITGAFTATVGSPVVNPATAPIINVTAPGTYRLWDASPGIMFGWPAPFHFSAARIQIDTVVGREFYLIGTNTCTNNVPVPTSFHLDDALFLNSTTLIAGSQGSDVSYGSLPGGINLTALLSVGIHSISAWNAVDSFWYSDALLLRTTSTCAYAISPVSYSCPASGGKNTVIMTTTKGCNWTAVYNDAWIVGGGSGDRSGSFKYTVLENTDPAPRVGTISVGGLTHTVYQAGTSNPTGGTGAVVSWVREPLPDTANEAYAVVSYPNGYQPSVNVFETLGVPVWNTWAHGVCRDPAYTVRVVEGIIFLYDQATGLEVGLGEVVASVDIWLISEVGSVWPSRS